MNVVEMRDITKVYGSGRTKVRALSLKALDVGKGEFLAIEGPSGCGKSTLVHIMGLLERSTSGTFELAGRNVGRMSEAERGRFRNEHLGFVFQRYNLLPDLTVYNNIALPLVPTKLKRAERRRRVEDALRQVGLEDRAHYYPSQISGGQEQRAAIARAIVNRPDLLIADEPTGNLDRKNAEALLQLIERLQKDLGTTVVLVTHDPEVSKHAKRVLRNTVTK